MAKDFASAVKGRRTIYGLSKESSVSDERIQEAVEYAVLHTPSSFNSQSARVVLLFGESHDKLWDLTKEELRKIVPEENFSSTEERINGFKNGYGTVLFFEDQETIKEFQKKFELYKDNFPTWSQQSSGMLQYVVWTSLEIEGLGASLQHYNPLIDEGIRKQWGVPESWQLIAQMPFGKPTAGPGDKDFKPIEERMKIFK